MKEPTTPEEFYDWIVNTGIYIKKLREESAMYRSQRNKARAELAALRAQVSE